MIYHTGISERTGRIEMQQGPLWLRTHGGGCVVCHGLNGTGGISITDPVISPDIRYSSLTSLEPLQGNTDEKKGRYSDELIKRAVTTGVNAEGEMLHWIMPRWQMSDEDLNDLMEFLKALN